MTKGIHISGFTERTTKNCAANIAAIHSAERTPFVIQHLMAT